MQYRCAKDWWKYCNGEPVWDGEPQRFGTEENPMLSGKCKLEQSNCGKCIKWSELVKAPEIKKVTHEVA
jgi:hypothetical protein